MSAQPSPQTQARSSVLFIDDEPRVLNSMRIMFRRKYDTFFAENGPAALNILKSQNIDVIVCDHRMPHMTGVEVLARARALSPRSVRILLTGYADLNAVEGSINEGEVFRFLTKPCAPDELKRTIALASSLAQEAHAEDASPPDTQARRSQESADSEDAFDVTATIVLDEKPAVAAAAAEAEQKAQIERRQGLGVLVFTNDHDIVKVVEDATRGRVPLYHATNIVQVVKMLQEHQPGVLLTDISDDRSTIQTMTARLKQHLPQLVTIAVSEHRDVLDMVWLINHGQIFRFLRKPLSTGRCAISLKAGLEHHQKLLRNPGLVNRYQVEATAGDGDTAGIVAKLGFLKRLWGAH